MTTKRQSSFKCSRLSSGGVFVLMISVIIVRENVVTGFPAAPFFCETVVVARDWGRENGYSSTNGGCLAPRSLPPPQQECQRLALRISGIGGSHAVRKKQWQCSGRMPLLRYSSSGQSGGDGHSTQAASGRWDDRVDMVLSRLTSLFPLFVILASATAVCQPVALNWVNRGDTITAMLASVMVGMGMTLEASDFREVFTKNGAAIPTGVLCQFGIMPLSAYFVGTAMLKQFSSSLFLGLVLVGCSPGGTASNLVSLIAGADVALSVIRTTCSTLLASIATPLLVKLIVGNTVNVNGWALCSATAKVVLCPVLLGMIINSNLPRLSKGVSRFTPFASVLFVSLICGGVMAQNAAIVLGTSAANVSMRYILGAVALMHSIGFAIGYGIPREILGFSSKTSKTISIETGMQNSALAVVLARSIGASPLASLPGALSATIHSCLGSGLAAYWRLKAISTPSSS